MDYNTFKIERALKVNRDRQFKLASGKAYRTSGAKNIGKHGWKEKQERPSDVLRELYVNGECVLKETLRSKIK